MNRSHLSTFNLWLDGLFGGRSTPPNTTPTDANLLDVQSAARQLHDLARPTGQIPESSSLPPTWEEFMHAHHLEASPRINRASRAPHQSSGTVGRGNPNLLDALYGRPARLAGNVIVTAIVLAVVLAGGWRAVQHYSPGPPEQPATIPFGAFVQDDATPDLAPPADLPTADDCTIEPLTVDDVIWYITDPSASQRTSPDAEPLAGFPYRDPATPPATNEPMGPADQEDLDEMVATQRMWMACVLADSPFQVWATISPEVVGRELSYTFPRLTGEEEAREMLEALEAGAYEPTSQYDSFPGYLGSTCSDVAIISSDPARSYGYDYVAAVPEGTEGRTGYYIVDLLWSDGPMTSTGYATPASAAELNDSLSYGRGFVFRWNEARQMWMLDSWPNCG